ncbi:MAG: glycosyltransferase [Candidatus Dadabacteria bacterium]|nr:MAG: glycosyltransferase [Candidatus Dadabacteria bacterium]
MEISIVIPALNEGARIGDVVQTLLRQRPAALIVADGGSTDDTVEAAVRAGAHVVRSSPGRGAQLAAGVAAVRTDGVWVVHADTRVPEDGVRQVERALDEVPFGAFHLAIDHPARVYRIIEFGVRLRIRLFHLVYGDQAMFFRKDAYEQVGGFPDIPLMEDVALCRRFIEAGMSPHLLRASVVTNARRWERDGPWRRTFGNWSLLFRYLVLGHAPDRLLPHYQPEPPSE